jgi:hypothetical protein
LPALLDLGETVMQGADERVAALRVLQQVVLEIGIARHHPDVAQHLVQHAGGAAGAALGAQLEQRLPGVVAEQPDDDFAVGERRVVVGDLAETDGH